MTRYKVFFFNGRLPNKRLISNFNDIKRAPSRCNQTYILYIVCIINKTISTLQCIPKGICFEQK